MQRESSRALDWGILPLSSASFHPSWSDRKTLLPQLQLSQPTSKWLHRYWFNHLPNHRLPEHIVFRNWSLRSYSSHPTTGMKLSRRCKNDTVTWRQCTVVTLKVRKDRISTSPTQESTSVCTSCWIYRARTATSWYRLTILTEVCTTSCITPIQYSIQHFKVATYWKPLKWNRRQPTADSASTTWFWRTIRIPTATTSGSCSWWSTFPKAPSSNSTSSIWKIQTASMPLEWSQQCCPSSSSGLQPKPGIGRGPMFNTLPIICWGRGTTTPGTGSSASRTSLTSSKTWSTLLLRSPIATASSCAVSLSGSTV